MAHTAAQQVIDALEKAAEEHVPGLIRDGLNKAAESVTNPVARAALQVLNGFAVDATPAVLSQAAHALSGLLDGSDPSAVFTSGLDAAALSDLTDTLQTAEAKHVEETSKLLRKLGALLALGGKLALQGALTALKG